MLTTLIKTISFIRIAVPDNYFSKCQSVEWWLFSKNNFNSYYFNDSYL